ncbi:MAG: hypothetical protein AMS21_07355 [Gemmatimonas sp. SG8_38_2]|nr:MAG: hypothetical protein AMS21_07355 [Gemmatimonas sp. SG8_38_2]
MRLSCDRIESKRFVLYRDVREPNAMVSEDATLGWLIAHVEVSGVRTLSAGTEEPVYFVSAWIELYRKEGEKRILIGNLSNFSPEVN